MPGVFIPAPPNDKEIIFIYKRTSISNPEKYAENIPENINSPTSDKNIQPHLINTNPFHSSVHMQKDK